MAEIPFLAALAPSLIGTGVGLAQQSKLRKDLAERQKQVINLTILQLENGADTDLILKILKQSQVEAEE